VAEVLNVERDKVLVVDVRESHITLEHPEGRSPARRLFRNGEENPGRLGLLPGVPSGRLPGSIPTASWDDALDEGEARGVLERTKDPRLRGQERGSRAAPASSDRLRGETRDDPRTNTPAIVEFLRSRGFTTERGESSTTTRTSSRVASGAPAMKASARRHDGRASARRRRTGRWKPCSPVDPEGGNSVYCHFERGTGRTRRRRPDSRRTGRGVFHPRPAGAERRGYARPEGIGRGAEGRLGQKAAGRSRSRRPEE
jgi:hypothetical protein